MKHSVDQAKDLSKAEPFSHIDWVQGLLAFLDAEPYYHASVWNALLDKEKNGGGKDALLPLSSLLRGLMLRRQLQDVGKLHIVILTFYNYALWLCWKRSSGSDDEPRVHTSTLPVSRPDTLHTEPR